MWIEVLVAERNNFIYKVHGGFSCFFLLRVKKKKKKQGVVLPQREMTSCPRVREKCRTNLSKHVKLYKIHGNGFLFF